MIYQFDKLIFLICLWFEYDYVMTKWITVSNLSSTFPPKQAAASMKSQIIRHYKSDWVERFADFITIIFFHLSELYPFWELNLDLQNGTIFFSRFFLLTLTILVGKISAWYFRDITSLS